MDDSEADLAKLIQQLAKRVPGCELDLDVLKAQVASFKTTEAEILKKIGTPSSKKESLESIEENSVAKLVEEMKSLPSRVAERLSDGDDPFIRRRRSRRFHPVMLQELMHMTGDPGDPVAILMAASLVRDDAPWLYELAMEVYRAVKSGEPAVIESEITRLDRFSQEMMHGPFMEEFGSGDKQTYMLLREFPRMLRHMLDKTLGSQKQNHRRRPPRSSSDKT
jgi:hypothetical protein